MALRRYLLAFQTFLCQVLATHLEQLVNPELAKTQCSDGYHPRASEIFLPSPDLTSPFDLRSTGTMESPPPARTSSIQVTPSFSVSLGLQATSPSLNLRGTKGPPRPTKKDSQPKSQPLASGDDPRRLAESKFPYKDLDIEYIAKLAVKNVLTILGPELSAGMSEDLGFRMSEGQLIGMFASPGEAIKKLGGELQPSTPDLTSHLIKSNMNKTPMNNLMLMVDGPVLLLKLFDYTGPLEDDHPYKFGTCTKSSNLCWGTDGSTHKCQHKYPCDKGGAKCAYRHEQLPGRVVCNYNDFEAWTRMTGLLPTKAAFRSFKGLESRREYHYALTKARHWHDKFEKCLAKHRATTCRIYDSISHTWNNTAAFHSTRMDYMKDNGAKIMATYNWQSAEYYSRRYKESHLVAAFRQNHLDTIGNSSLSTVEVLKRDLKAAKRVESYWHKQLNTTWHRARSNTFKADPVGMTNLISNRLATPWNATESDGPPFKNFGIHPDITHGIAHHAKPTNASIVMDEVLEKKFWDAVM